MEFAELGDVRQNIETVIQTWKTTGAQSFIPEENIWKIFVQCLKGLNELHLRGVWHRDIKTANLFIHKNNVIKLGDFNASIVLNEAHFK